MSLADAAWRQDIREAMGKVLSGEKPRDPFEAVLFREAREKLRNADLIR